MQTPDENSEINYKKPGFTGMAKIIWLLTQRSNPLEMLKEANKLNGYIGQQMKKSNFNPKSEEMDQLLGYAQYATVLYQYAGHYQPAAKFASHMTDLFMQYRKANEHQEVTRSFAAIGHAGAFSSVMAHHETKNEKPDPFWLERANRMHLLASAAYIDLGASHARAAALIGTNALIQFSKGNIDRAEDFLRKAEDLNKGQMKKELSDSWPKSVNGQHDFSEWNRIVGKISPEVNNQKNLRKM